jgi:hypothetical protein
MSEGETDMEAVTAALQLLVTDLSDRQKRDAVLTLFPMDFLVLNSSDVYLIEICIKEISGALYQVMFYSDGQSPLGKAAQEIIRGYVDQATRAVTRLASLTIAGRII